MTSMSVQEAEQKLQSMRDEHERIKNSRDIVEREYASYLSVQIHAYDRAIREFKSGGAA